MTRPGIRWTVCLAWRDSRGSRVHLLVSMAALALGMAALVAVRAFGDRLEEAVQGQARSLLGADFSLRSMQPLDAAAEAFLAGLPGRQVRETRFYAMVRAASAASEPRLCQVRALSGSFPFYGSMETDPPEAAAALTGGAGLAVAEKGVLLPLGVAVGGDLQIGEATVRVAGELVRVSGESPAAAAFMGPRLYIGMDTLAQTGLIREGSLAWHIVHVQVPPGTDVEALRRAWRTELGELRLEMETVEQRQRMLGDALGNLTKFLNLGALAALVLGGIGCASAMHLYARSKRTSVSILRCLGATPGQAFAVYLSQAVGAALVASAVGAGLGLGLARMLPGLLRDVLPVAVAGGGVGASVAWSLGLGGGLSLLFALVPLVGLRRASPMAALRMGEGPAAGRPDPVRWAVLAALAGGLLAACAAQTEPWTRGLILGPALLGVLAALAGTARGLMVLLRRLQNDRWPFVWRQGLANIHRPHNQTLVLLMALGLGVFLLSVLTLTQDNLLRQLQATDAEDDPNLILFDVRPDQVASVGEVLRERDLPRLEAPPIVTLRLVSVRGRPVGALRDDPSLEIPHWVLFREYRCTYRADLLPRERVIRGTWEGRAPAAGPIPISIEKELAGHLDAELGDELVFDLQGVRLRTVVRSVREVDWRKMQTNFFVIFPAGVLEQAPQMFAVVTRTPSPEASARLQNAVIERHPNISAIDLRMLVETLSTVLAKAAGVVRLMAGFSVLAGLLVLGTTVAVSRYDRQEETRLLRTLGAGRSQLNRILSAEVLLLGGLAAVAGSGLALGAAWALSRMLFEVPFTPSLRGAVGLPLLVVGLTWGVGLLLTRAVSPVRGS